MKIVKLCEVIILLAVFLASGEARAKDELDKCVGAIESWLKVSLEFNRSAQKESTDFLKELERRLKDKEPRGLDVELLELRDELAAIKGGKAKLKYCRKKLEDARTATTLWRKDIKVSQEKGEKVPLPVVKFFDELDHSLKGSAELAQ